MGLFQHGGAEMVGKKWLYFLSVFGNELVAVALTFSLVVSSSGTVLQEWRFDDVQGTSLEAALNSVDGGASFQHSGVYSDGNGNCLIGSSSDLYAADIADVESGTLFLRVDLNGWRLGGTGTEEMLIFRMEGLGNVRLVLNRSGAEARLQGWTSGDGQSLGVFSTKPTDYPQSLCVILEINMDQALYRVLYGAEGGWTESVWNALPSEFRVHRFVIAKSGDYADNGDYIKIDRILISNERDDALPPENELAAQIFGSRPAPLTNLVTQTVLDTTNFGLIPDDGTNDYVAFSSLVEVARTSTPPVKINFAPGVYNFSSAEQVLTTRDGSLNLSGLRNVVVDGNGSRIMINRSHMGFVYAENCTNVIVRNFEIDYDPLPFCQGTVLSLDAAEGSFLFEKDSGYPDPHEDPFFASPSWSWGMAKNRNYPGRLKPDCPDFFFIHRPEPTGSNGVFKISMVNPPQLTHLDVGDPFVINCRAGSIGNAPNTENITFQNLTVYAAPSCLFIGSRLSMLNVLDCRALLTGGRLMVSGADGVHCQSGRVGPWVEGCEFEGLSDDHLNIYSIPHKILGQPSSNIINVARAHWIRPGDRLLFFNPRAGMVIDIGEAVSVDSETVFLGKTVEGLVYTEEDLGYVPGSDAEYDHIYNLDATGSGFVFKNNYIHDGRRHGCVVKASRGLIKNNLFENISGHALNICNLPSRPEGFWAQDIIISNNTVNWCGSLNYRHPVMVAAYAQGNVLMANRVQQNIYLMDNWISSQQESPLFFSSVSNLTVSGNTFIAETGTNICVEMEHASQVCLENNIYKVSDGTSVEWTDAVRVGTDCDAITLEE